MDRRPGCINVSRFLGIFSMVAPYDRFGACLLTFARSPRLDEHMIGLVRICTTAIALTTIFPFPGSAQSVAEFYTGKQITLIVGAGVGGGYDLQARLTARHLGRHVPGHPGIIVQNMPAAGGIAATNHIASTAPKDGATI